MLKPIIKLAGVTLLIACTWVGSASAQTAPSPKRALIKELLELTRAGDSANDILSQNLAQMEVELPKLLSGFLEDSGLEGEALKKQANATALRIIKRYQERVPKVLDFNNLHLLRRGGGVRLRPC